MRYGKEHNDAVRSRIIRTASLRFRKDGIGAVGLAPLMREAGLTHGTFYTHFGSKEDLVADTVAELNRERLASISATLEQPDGLHIFIRSFLSESHRDTFSAGCLNASIMGELARESDRVRCIYSDGTFELIDLLASHLDRCPKEGRRAAAIALFSMICGGIQSARVVPDPVLSKEILDSTATMAIALVSGPGSPG